jgi:hypothetical protein
MPITYRDRGISGTQLDVLSGDLVIGTVYKISAGAGRVERWSWTFTITAAPAGFAHRGNAQSLDEAKLGIERNWKDWMKAAGLLDWPRV